jgi:outer membrane autotransporter protein
LIINKTADPTLTTTNPTVQKTFETLSTIQNASGALLTLQNYILDETKSTAAREEAVKSITPQADNSTNRSAFVAASASVDTAGQRLSNIRSGVSSGDDKVAKGMWVQAFGGNASQRNTPQSNGYDLRSGGVAVGMDREMFNDSRLGLSFSQANSQVKARGGAKSISVVSYQTNLYGTTNFANNFFIDGLAGLSLNRYTSNRSIALTGNTATAYYSGQTYIAKVEGGKVNDLGNGFSLTPKAGFTFAHNKIDDYSENGAGTLNLSVATKSSNFFEARAGFNAGYTTTNSKGTKIAPEINLSYGHDFVGAKQVSTSNFVGQNTSFTSEGSNVRRGSLRTGVALNIFQANAISMNLEYGFERRISYHGHSASARVRYDF